MSVKYDYNPPTSVIGSTVFYSVSVLKPRVRLLCLCAQTQSMGTKTIGVRENVYERLNARKRENESFTDLMNRLLDETQADWREGFGTLDAEEAEELEQVVETSRKDLGTGLAARQQEALKELSNTENTDETA